MRTFDWGDSDDDSDTVKLRSFSSHRLVHLSAQRDRATVATVQEAEAQIADAMRAAERAIAGEVKARCLTK